MRFKLVYSAPVSVCDSLEEPVKDPRILSALADVSCLEGTVLEYLDTRFPDQADFRGGYLRLTPDKKRLKVQIEIDCPRELEKSELSQLRESLDGQVSDGIGEGGFDFVETSANLTITTFPELGGGKSSLVQITGEAWKPGSVQSESDANCRRCEEAAAAAKAVEQEKTEKQGKRKNPKPDPKKLFKLIQKSCDRPRPDGIEQEIAAEIAALRGDLSFIKSGKFPYERLSDPVLLRMLLESGLNPHLQDRDGHSFLWLACGNPECIAFLLDSGVDVNIRNAEVYEATALMEAAWFGKIASVRLLLDRGADPFLKDRFGRTALDIARKNTHFGDHPATIHALQEAMDRKGEDAG
jgi:hypothetical protein